ncbi:hypothetical protein [Candidatus Korobacter versatilis]|nr:hypothetical protein [Candidatus Koribacter versatilis]
MRFSWILICGLAFGWIVTCGSARGEDPPGHCFRMALVDDGKPVDAPARITFADGSEREEVEAHDNRYCVPDSMMNAETLDLMFEASGSRFNLFHVRMHLFDSDWDVAFGNKRYAHEEHLAKSIHFEESCTLHIHQDEGDKDLTIAACRLALTRQK